MRKFLVFAALTGLLAFGGPTPPSGAGVALVPDDGTSDGVTHGDANSLQISHTATALSLQLVVSSGEDPATANNWTNANSETHIEFDIDTNGTGGEEFYVIYASDVDGIYADVYRASDDGNVCSPDPTFSSGAGVYGVQIPRTCIGTPASVRVNGTIFYDPTPGSGSDTSIDSVPDSGFSSAVAADSASVDREVRAGVVGQSDNQLWVGHGESGVFDPMGGQLLAAPAVARIAQPSPDAEGTPVFVATGSDHQLWIRVPAQSWRPLSTAHTYCIDSPAAVVYGTGGGAQDITVACQGSDNALWTSSGPITPTSLPTLNNWRRIGGVLTAGPAVSISQFDHKTVAYLVVGAGGKVYQSNGIGFAPTPWTCKNHVAFGTLNDVSWFGCRGTDDALWAAKNTATGWSNAFSLGGRLTEGPGVAVADASSVFFVQGTDNALWQRVVDNDDNTPLSLFTSDGGRIKYGVNASSL